MNKGITLEASKSQLAKLMAAENITVNHLNVTTARFDLKNRILTCPIWKDMSGCIYDLLMGHEISHALNTPMSGWHDAIVNDKKRKNLKRYLNVVEDARIERIIKNKYPGLKKSFGEAYQELFNRDLFQIKKLKGDYSKLNLIDRINLYFKLGAQTLVTFTKAEQVFVNRVMAATTWEEVEQVSKDIYDYSKINEKKKIQNKEQVKQEAQKTPKQKQEEKEQEEGDTEESDEGESQESEDGEEEENEAGKDGEESDESEAGDDAGDKSEGTGDEEEETDEETQAEGDGEETDEETESGSKSEESDGESDSKEQSDESSEPKSSKKTDAGLSGDKKASQEEAEGTEEDIEPDSVTDEAFRQLEDSLVDKNAKSVMYFNIPNVNLDHCIIPNKTVLSYFEVGMEQAMGRALQPLNYTEVSTKLATAFHKRNKNYISTLVKEFEMRKNANQYARQSVSRTGVIDAKKLSSYKFNSDLFKRITTIQKGKSHGMIIMLDWSGSMLGIARQVIEQLCILTTFCKKIGIPFDVYSFTDGHTYTGQHSPFRTKENDADTMYRFGLYANKFGIRHLISSDLGGNTYRRAFNMMLMLAEVTSAPGRSKQVAECFGKSPTFTLKNLDGVGMAMGGTPFIQSLVAARQMIEAFNNKHHTDILNMIWLTDGDGDGTITYPTAYQTLPPYDRQNVRIGVQDPITRKRVDITNNNMQAAITELLMQVTGCNQIGYFLTDAQSAAYRISNYYGYGNEQGPEKKKHDEVLSDMAKKGYHAAPSLGYNKYFYLDVTKANQDVMPSINAFMDDATKQKVFSDVAQIKKNQKAIIKEFATEISDFT